MMRYTGIPPFLKANPEIELPFAGARGWLLQGEAQQVVAVEFTEAVEVPEHSHADQWEFVLSGRVELRREGRIEIHEAGDNFFIPAGQPHSATVHAGYLCLILFDEAQRYEAKKA